MGERLGFSAPPPEKKTLSQSIVTLTLTLRMVRKKAASAVQVLGEGHCDESNRWKFFTDQFSQWKRKRGDQRERRLGRSGRRFDEKEDMKQRAGNGEPAARERMQHCLPAGRAPSKVMVVNFNRALRVPAAVS